MDLKRIKVKAGLDNMDSPNSLSPITRVMLSGKQEELPLLIPTNEQFRLKNIFIDHEYLIKPTYLPSTPLIVVDIGANVGLFTLYMMMNYSIDTIHCFEPAPASLELLRHNTAGSDSIHVHPYGLINRNGTELLVLHPKNSGENRIAEGEAIDAETVEIQVRDAAEALDRLGLTYIDVLKIDTEGCEVQILESLGPRLSYVGIVLLEYHSDADRRKIDQLLSRFKLVGANAECIDRGIVKYLNRRLLSKA